MPISLFSPQTQAPIVTPRPGQPHVAAAWGSIEWGAGGNAVSANPIPTVQINVLAAPGPRAFGTIAAVQVDNTQSRSPVRCQSPQGNWAFNVGPGEFAQCPIPIAGTSVVITAPCGACVSDVTNYVLSNAHMPPGRFSSPNYRNPTPAAGGTILSAGTYFDTGEITLGSSGSTNIWTQDVLIPRMDWDISGAVCTTSGHIIFSLENVASGTVMQQKTIAFESGQSIPFQTIFHLNQGDYIVGAGGIKLQQTVFSAAFSSGWLDITGIAL